MKQRVEGARKKSLSTILDRGVFVENTSPFFDFELCDLGGENQFVAILKGWMSQRIQVNALQRF